MPVKLTPELVRGFTELFLISQYDNPKPIPDFHDEMWKECCSDDEWVAIAAPRGHAKAQALESKVLTPTGWRLIGELSIGDWVIGGSGLPVKVTRLHPIQEMDLYRVTTRDGKSALCNLGHIWNVENRANQKGVIQQKTLEEILVNWKSDRVDKRNGKEYTEYRYRIPAIAPVFGGTVDYELDPYTLGCWLGDGHSAGSRFTTDDPEILTYFPYPTEKQSGKYGYVIRDIQPDLKGLSLINNKHIPEKYFFGSIEQRLMLLRGLMDTDGTIHQDGNIGYFCNTNYKLIDGIVDLIRGLGGIATINTNYTMCNGKRFKSWRVSCKLAYNPFRLKRKADKWKGSFSLSSYIVSIEKEKTGLGRCISVEGEIYITDDYLQTHNSTAITHAYTLANLLFRIHDHILLVSDTEKQAVDFLGDIKMELLENDALREQFDIKKLIKDSETEIIGQFTDGVRFRVIVKGSEQKLRGMKWRGKRPNLFIIDDFENDESVMNSERREKSRNWLMNALIPGGSDNCIVRMVGTILHLDSTLNRLLNNKTWRTKKFAAHGRDFSNILWPEKFSRARLQKLRDLFEEEGNLDGYNQEYLNNPVAEGNTYFRPQDFIPMDAPDHESHKIYVAAADFAISESERADYTVIMVAGIDEKGVIHIVDVRRARIDSLDIIDELLSVQQRYEPDLFIFETEKIDKAIGPFLDKAMREGTETMPPGLFINIVKKTPSKSKTTRGKSSQGMMKSGSVRWDTDADWYADTYMELMTMTPGGSKGKNDDTFDAFAYIGMAVNMFNEAPTAQEMEDEEYNDEFFDDMELGRCLSTGY